VLPVPAAAAAAAAPAAVNQPPYGRPHPRLLQLGSWGLQAVPVGFYEPPGSLALLVPGPVQLLLL
jgi:hypothetical protein